MIVLILGSGPNAIEATGWPGGLFDRIVAINNAHAVRPDWNICIHPEDFPEEKRPTPGHGQRLVGADEFVPIQNDYGGFVYAGGTMAFTAGYWALGALKPRVLAFMGCDMVYSATGNTHFYGKGEADPLRADVTLRSLEAKSARLAAHAALQGCAVINLSRAPESRLVFTRGRPEALSDARPLPLDSRAVDAAQTEEARLGYMVWSGRYWEVEDQFDPRRIDALDDLWRKTI